MASSLGNDESGYQDISFGALAKAQATLGRKRKRSQSIQAGQQSSNPRSLTNKSDDSKGEAPKSPKVEIAHRTTKHGPTAQSTKVPVSRKRTILEPSPAYKSRDPRFDPAVMGSHLSTSVDTANKNYSFLGSYRDSELSTLRSELKKTKNEDLKERLKRQVMAMENRKRAADAKDLERDIIRKHRQREKELIKEGKKSKPYFLKRSDVKKEALTEKFTSMGAKQRDKALRKKRKKLAGKELKAMPRQRRG